jgi:hypothetical protein
VASGEASASSVYTVPGADLVPGMTATVAAAGNKLPAGLTNRTGIAALATLAAASGVKDASPDGIRAYATQVTGLKLPTDLSVSGLASAVASAATGASSSAGSGGVAGGAGAVAAGGAAAASGSVLLPEGAATQVAAAAADRGPKMPKEMSPAGLLAAGSASGPASGASAGKQH